MALPPKLKRFSADAFDDAPEWFVSDFLPSFNDFATLTTNALSGGLTAPENINTYIESGVRVLLGGTPADTFPIILANRLGRKPTCVMVASYSVTNGTTPTAAVGVRWDVTSDGRIRILDFPGLQASSEYRVSLRVE